MVHSLAMSILLSIIVAALVPQTGQQVAPGLSDPGVARAADHAPRAPLEDQSLLDEDEPCQSVLSMSGDIRGLRATARLQWAALADLAREPGQERLREVMQPLLEGAEHDEKVMIGLAAGLDREVARRCY